MSHELPQNFDRRLRSELFFFGHIQIVNEHYCLHTETSWSEVTGSDFFDLSVNDVLNLIAVRLRAKADFNGQVFLSRQLVQQNVLNVD